mmetsp:Transcript_30849/g.34511  ORF Transcript_30849/g.34511 Transcript_30849/m.34511 type:complete len:84 (-) Transcript_30849:356-607(-)
MMTKMTMKKRKRERERESRVSLLTHRVNESVQLFLSEMVESGEWRCSIVERRSNGAGSVQTAAEGKHHSIRRQAGSEADRQTE